MAINKNFVIKHGVEVDTKLLVGDSNTQKVGIGTTVPQYSLHVGGLRGGIGASDAYVSGVTTVRDLHVTGITTFDTGRVLIGAGASTGTRSQLLHVGSATTEGGVYISGDVGLGVTLPGAKLNVVPGSSAIAGLFSGTTEKDMVRITQLGGGNALRVDDIASDASPFVITGIGSVGIGTTNPKYALVVDSLVSTGTTALFVHGDAQITGDLIVDDFSLDELSVDQINVTGILTSAQTNLVGTTTAVNINVTGVTTLTSIGSNLIPDVDGTRHIGAATSEWGDLFLDGTANIDALVADTAIVSDLTDNRVVIAGSSGELEDDANFTFDGSKLNVGVGVATIGVNGNAAFAGIVTVGGNLYVTGDIHYDEVTGRNLNISGIATFAEIGSNLIPDADGTRNIGAATSEWGDLFIDGTANIDALVADTAQVSDLTNTRVVYAGASGELSDDSTLTFNSTTKVLSVQELVGVHTSAGGGGVGIASTTAHVGYGFTYIQFKGPGVSTVYASSTTGIATIFFQGGGTAGAAGTWSPEGSIGVSTSKSVGVNTTSLSDADLQGIGNTFQGLYIGNGMVVTDNQLNGNHYIGTAYNGLMAGPVTVNGVLTVDGNWAVV